MRRVRRAMPAGVGSSVEIFSTALAPVRGSESNELAVGVNTGINEVVGRPEAGRQEAAESIASRIACETPHFPRLTYRAYRNLRCRRFSHLFAPAGRSRPFARHQFYLSCR